MNKDRNYTLAAQYFEESHRHGNPDAASHLGILHLHGYYPNKTADPVNQLLFYAIFFSQFTLIDLLSFSTLYRQYFSHATAVHLHRFLKVLVS